MLSVLIPTYNYNIHPLVREIHDQVLTCNIDFEIIIIDDASTIQSYDIDIFNSFNRIKHIALSENIGRSAIRNLLAKNACYANLLFIDAGTFPRSKAFVRSYLNQINYDVVIGGMIEEEFRPKKPFRLRWLYTKKREANNQKNILTSANFLIKKAIIKKYPFDETIKQYGYEDLIFFNNLKSNEILLNFVKNPVVHDCKEDAEAFVSKTELALQNLVSLSQTHQNLIEDNTIIKLYEKLNDLKLRWLVVTIFKATKSLLIKNFNSSNPSLRLFDFYKLGYFCNIKQKS